VWVVRVAAGAVPVLAALLVVASCGLSDSVLVCRCGSCTIMNHDRHMAAAAMVYVLIVCVSLTNGSSGCYCA
jgi:predicted anti-sigma-YlaC factor YlaD